MRDHMYLIRAQASIIQGAELKQKSFYLHDVLLCRIDPLSDLLYLIFAQFEYQKSRLHVLPRYFKVYLLYGHIPVQVDHVGTFVVIGASEQEGEELNHGRMQFGDVADSLQEKVVDAFICEDELIELSYHFFKLVVAADLFEESWHRLI